MPLTVKSSLSKAIKRCATPAIIGCTAVLLLTGLLTPSSAKAAAVSPATSISFGSVDIAKVLAGYKQKSDSEADFQKIVDQYDTTYKIQSSSPMLSAADQATLGTLLLKVNPTPADQDEIKTLEAKSSADAAELAGLQQKTSLTDTDKPRLTVLTQEQQNGQQALQQLGDQYKQTLDQKNQIASQKIADEVRAAVATVAQQKGLTVVFDSSVAIYCTNDVTSAVLNKLNTDTK